MTTYNLPERDYRNGLGLTALILGIVGLSLAWIPIVGYLSVILGVVGVTLAVVGFVRIRRGGANNPVVTVFGLLTSIAAVVLAFVAFAAFASAVDEGVTEFESEMDALDAELEEIDAEFDAEMDALDAELEAYDECAAEAGDNLDALAAC
ncbi:MAG: hypothetical protein GEU78_15045 [Actinobacteria bacterium]|nr:hypothetical protein [Actinomycetota bacterium]